jgi:hypothetical protein
MKQELDIAMDRDLIAHVVEELGVSEESVKDVLSYMGEFLHNGQFNGEINSVIFPHIGVVYKSKGLMYKVAKGLSNRPNATHAEIRVRRAAKEGIKYFKENMEKFEGKYLNMNSPRFFSKYFRVGYNYEELENFQNYGIKKSEDNSQGL